MKIKINLNNSVPIVLNRRIPISLVPRESLIAILESIHRSQRIAEDRLTLAIPMTDLLSYYDAQLVREVATLDTGILLTLAIPMSSRQTAFNMYKADRISMPRTDSSQALMWVTEGPYLAISEDSIERAILSRENFDNCLGSAHFKVCHESLASQLGSSCLANLYFHNTVKVLAVCDTERYLLPSLVKAAHLGYGIWLVTSASEAFTLRAYNIDKDKIPGNKEHPGCKFCLIALECSFQIIS